jgi:undecaprenyl diphosphate synthase
LRRVVRAAPACGVETLTVLGFSTRDWYRPQAEVEYRFSLLKEFLWEEAPRYARRGVRVEVVGRRERIPSSLREAIDDAERATAGCHRLRFRLAVDYSAREALLRAACRLYTSLEISLEAFGRLLAGAADHNSAPPSVDLLIRTGGQKRLDDFLLWEAAQAEVCFSTKLWPEFTAKDLRAAVTQMCARHARSRLVPALAVAS